MIICAPVPEPPFNLITATEFRQRCCRQVTVGKNRRDLGGGNFVDTSRQGRPILPHSRLRWSTPRSAKGARATVEKDANRSGAPLAQARWLKYCKPRLGKLRVALEALDSLRLTRFLRRTGSHFAGKRSRFKTGRVPAAVGFNRLLTTLPHTSAHAESIRCERSSLHEHFSDAPMGRPRSATGHAPGNEAVADRIECFAHRSGTTTCCGPGSAQNKRIALCVRQSNYGESRHVATGGGAP